MTDTHKTRVALLRAELKRRKLTGFFVPRADEFQGEYVPPHAERLRWLTNFRGSAGIAVVTLKKAAIFVDGRYTLQVRKEVDEKLFTPVNMGETSPERWIEDNLRDITTAEGFPSGAMMLEMALNMEAQQEARFRSKVRLQSGGVALEYVATDDDATVQKMAIFERFALEPIFA